MTIFQLFSHNEKYIGRVVLEYLCMMTGYVIFGLKGEED